MSEINKVTYSKIRPKKVKGLRGHRANCVCAHTHTSVSDGGGAMVTRGRRPKITAYIQMVGGSVIS